MARDIQKQLGANGSEWCRNKDVLVDKQQNVIFEKAGASTDSALAAVFGAERTLVIARELTKVFETVHSCVLGEASDWLQADANRQRGEFVLMLSGATAGSDSGEGERVLKLLLALLVMAGVLWFGMGREAGWLQAAGLELRHGVQFHWHNAGYAHFEDFLARLTHAKRKKIRQERRKVAEAGIAFRILRGAQIQADDWAFFHACYARTYAEHRSTPYLSRAFFADHASQAGDACVLMIAERAGQPVAASFFLQGADALYGRYWGAVEYIPCLHFEACYYQAIAYAIAEGISRFEGGAQGEHKLSRGLEPVRTTSAHWIADPRFADAVADFLARERGGVEDYLDELSERLPFRAGDTP
mgnify:CR=1 FL=1